MTDNNYWNTFDPVHSPYFQKKKLIQHRYNFRKQLVTSPFVTSDDLNCENTYLDMLVHIFFGAKHIGHNVVVPN